MARKAIDHLVKLEGFNSRTMGTCSLTLIVAKGQMAGAEVAPRAPLVAEVRVDSVPMGREGGGAAWEVGNQVRAWFSDTM
jgi:hypothetical protein